MEKSLETRIGTLLQAQDLKLVLAESCTGGLIGHRVTNVPGCSDYYLGSVTAYANEAKERLLGVRRATLHQHGAVSREAAVEMARGARQALAGELSAEQVVGMSVTGIAGPGGGLPGKPVGLTWVGLSSAKGEWAWRFFWKGDRIENKERSAQAVLQLLLDYLQGDLPAEG